MAKFWKILIILFILTALTSTYHFANSENFPDSKYYLDYTDFFLGETEFKDLTPPFSYRPLMPFLAAILPISPENGFGLLNFLFILGTAIITLLLLQDMGFKQSSALIGALLFIVSFPTFWYGSAVLADAAGMFFIALCLLLIFRKANPFLITGIICLGIFARETMVFLLIPAILTKIYNKRTILLASFPPLTILTIRYIFSNGPSYFWNFTILSNITRPLTYKVAILSLLPFIFIFYAKPKHLRFIISSAIGLSTITLTGLLLGYFDARFIWPLYFVLIPLNLQGFSIALPKIHKKIIRITEKIIE